MRATVLLQVECHVEVEEQYNSYYTVDSPLLCIEKLCCSFYEKCNTFFATLLLFWQFVNKLVSGCYCVAVGNWVDYTQ